MFGFQINFGQNHFCQLVIFGDSLSDIGNVYILTNYTYPISPPYYQGRFCDGPNWID
jgi:outer membrane lipase/esterase